MSTDPADLSAERPRNFGHALRNRMATAKDLLGLLHDNTLTTLKPQTLLNYQEKLQPIFSNAYFENLQVLTDDEFDRQRSQFILKHSLSVPLVTVTNLYVQPGEPYFPTWLFISSFFPLVAACLAPLGNLVSFVALLQHWRTDTATGHTVDDPNDVFLLNVLGFLLGIVGNASLLMNFSGKVRYLVTQCVSICCWISAASLLLAALLLARNSLPGTGYVPSEGFWLAVFTVAMYYLCSIILIINFGGYKLNKYPAAFNLDKKQRLLMAYTIAFSVWQAVGTLAMAALIPGLSYGTSLYYCTVSMLTIGLGDIVPKSPGAKVYALIFSLIGVLIMGLIVTMVRQVVISSAGPSLFWHNIEMRRLSVLEDYKKQNVAIESLSPDDSFQVMRKIRHSVKRRLRRWSLVNTIILFVLFWLIGALIFKYIEGWNYFNGVYFCFLCLVTIGYGDFHPDTALGRSFFVIWAISAVPLMTILISNLGDSLWDLADKLDCFTSTLVSWRTYQRLFHPDPEKAAAKSAWPNEGSSAEDATKAESQSGEGTTAAEPNTQSVGVELVEDLADSFSLLKRIWFDTMEAPEKTYAYDEWNELLTRLDEGTNGEIFWLGELSPLRLPLREANFILLKTLVKIDKDLSELLAHQKKEFAASVTSGVHTPRAL